MPFVQREFVVALGRELVSRGLVHQASAVRLYLIAMDRGLLDRKRELYVHVTPSFIIDWCGTLQIPPHHELFSVRPVASRGCPSCGEDATTHVELSVPGRTRVRCKACSLRWVALTSE